MANDAKCTNVSTKASISRASKTEPKELLPILTYLIKMLHTRSNIPMTLRKPSPILPEYIHFTYYSFQGAQSTRPSIVLQVKPPPQVLIGTGMPSTPHCMTVLLFSIWNQSLVIFHRQGNYPGHDIRPAPQEYSPGVQAEARPRKRVARGRVKVRRILLV